ncbi:MAG: hypothetical protein ACJAX3_001765, partial [Patiriisocius sp.]
DLFEEDGSAKGMRVILSIPTNKSIDKTA